jgi:FixJ family two-component response regulator
MMVAALSPSQSNPGERTEATAAEPSPRPLVGVVDDDVSILRAMRRLLKAAGFTVMTFGSGEELLAFEHLETIDCLVLDVHLGGLTGFEVRDRLAAGGRAIPVIFITAHDDEATQDHARRAGAADYLRKPFDDHALLGAIQKSLGGD